MSPAAWRVRAEVSGLPPGKWEKRLFMVLQAFFDESGNAPDQRVLVVGGLLGRAEKWVEFSSRWEAALQREPGAAYVKYSEITRGRGQFANDRGWDDDLRSARLTELVQIIRDHVIGIAFAAIKHADFERHLRTVETPFRSLINDHPYTLLAQHAVVPTLALLARHGLTDKCDFYFDALPGPDAIVQEIWPDLQAIPRTLHDGIFPVMPKIGDVSFRNGEDFLPLQASDIIAGMVRGSILGETPHPALLGFEGVDVAPHLITESQVRGWAVSLFQRQVEFKQKYPSAQMYSYDPATAKRWRKKFGDWLKLRG